MVLYAIGAATSVCCFPTLRAHSIQRTWVLLGLFTVALMTTAVALCTTCAHWIAYSADHALHPGIGVTWNPDSDWTQSIKPLLAAAKADTVAAALSPIGIGADVPSRPKPLA